MKNSTFTNCLPGPGRLANGLLLAIVTAALALNASAVQVAITLRNVALDYGTWAVNPWIGVHDGTFDIFDSGSAASAAVESAAEDGNGSLLAAAFGSSQPNGLSAVIAGPVAPGRTYTQVFDLDPADPDHRYLSYFAMVIPSNDAFWSNDDAEAYSIFEEASDFIPRSFKVYGSMVWDAGTEVNDEIGANTAFLAQAAPNTGMTEDGVVGLHPGFMAAGEGGILDQMVDRFGRTLSFAGADFSQPMYPVGEITVSLVNDAPSRFQNLSARGIASKSDSTHVVGFVIIPGADKQVLVRVVGPSLTNLGGENALSDPSVKIFNADEEEIGFNDNWVAAEVGEATNAAGAFALTANSADAAIMLTLPPGIYTAHVGNDTGSDGVVLVEVNEVAK